MAELLGASTACDEIFRVANIDYFELYILGMSSQMRVVNGERAIMSEANARGRLYIEARDIGTNRMLRSIEVVRSQALTKEAQFLLD